MNSIFIDNTDGGPEIKNYQNVIYIYIYSFVIIFTVKRFVALLFFIDNNC